MPDAAVWPELLILQIVVAAEGAVEELLPQLRLSDAGVKATVPALNESVR